MFLPIQVGTGKSATIAARPTMELAIRVRNEPIPVMMQEQRTSTQARCTGTTYSVSSAPEPTQLSQVKSSHDSDITLQRTYYRKVASTLDAAQITGN